MKKIKCFLIAIKDFICYGVWIRHLYADPEYSEGIVIASDTSFRISDNYAHNENERVYKNAIIEKCRCRYCNKEHISWGQSREVFGI